MIAARLERICLVLMSAVGDVVHGLPVVHALKRHSPGARITWVLQPGPAGLVQGHPAVDEILLLERVRGWRAFAELRSQLRTRQFDLVLELQAYLKAGLVTRFAQAPVKLGFDRSRARDLTWLFTTHRIPPHPPRHVQDQYLEFLAALGVEPEPMEWNLGPWPEERAWQQEFLAGIGRPIAAIVVATSKPEKDWPPERWAEVADALLEDYGLQPVLVGGQTPRELEAAQVIQARSRSAPISALGSGLRRLVGILDGAALVLSPDTGPLHVAVALNRPVISLMGYSNPKRTGPYRRFHDLMIDAYGDPGEDYPVSLQTRPGRMQRITTRDVLDKVATWRKVYGGPVAGRRDERPR